MPTTPTKNDGDVLNANEWNTHTHDTDGIVDGAITLAKLAFTNTHLYHLDTTLQTIDAYGNNNDSNYHTKFTCTIPTGLKYNTIYIFFNFGTRHTDSSRVADSYRGTGYLRILHNGNSIYSISAGTPDNIDATLATDRRLWVLPLNVIKITSVDNTIDNQIDLQLRATTISGTTAANVEAFCRLFAIWLAYEE